MQITFEYGTPYSTECHGGIETVSCKEDAVWTELVDGLFSGVLCGSCKHEVETYVSNTPLTNRY